MKQFGTLGSRQNFYATFVLHARINDLELNNVELFLFQKKKNLNSVRTMCLTMSKFKNLLQNENKDALPFLDVILFCNLLAGTIEP